MTKLTQARINALEIENAELRRDHPSLRDQFAMAAITGLLSDTERDISYEKAAVRAFEIADFMMEARDEEY